VIYRETSGQPPTGELCGQASNGGAGDHSLSHSVGSDWGLGGKFCWNLGKIPRTSWGGRRDWEDLRAWSWDGEWILVHKAQAGGPGVTEYRELGGKVWESTDKKCIMGVGSGM
jgi:hypothetical protein